VRILRFCRFRGRPPQSTDCKCKVRMLVFECPQCECPQCEPRTVGLFNRAAGPQTRNTTPVWSNWSCPLLVLYPHRGGKSRPKMQSMIWSWNLDRSIGSPLSSLFSYSKLIIPNVCCQILGSGFRHGTTFTDTYHVSASLSARPRRHSCDRRSPLQGSERDLERFAILFGSSKWAPYPPTDPNFQHFLKTASEGGSSKSWG
jgi:hypothetical protein